MIFLHRRQIRWKRLGRNARVHCDRRISWVDAIQVQGKKSEDGCILSDQKRTGRLAPTRSARVEGPVDGNSDPCLRRVPSVFCL